ncbi:MAG: phosphodiesterase [Proteobacteria bacterium]|nr:phosphodiesterase [Pseudomonadota bacterium]MBI3497870.1 phosphodiesterase [Pseudomonadota bacterium]
MLIAQITDLHIRRLGERAYSGEIDTAERLASTVVFLNDFQPRPDLVLATGDLVDYGRAEEYANLRRVLDPLQMPLYLIPGNHDDRAALRAAFPDHGYLPPEGFLHYTIEDRPLRLIGLDTIDPGKGSGLMCTERIAWLDARLAEAPGRPTLIFMHHPPFMTGIKEMDDLWCFGGDRMGEVVQRHPQVERVICGHLHRATQMRWYGTIALSTPATAPEVALTLRGHGTHGWELAPPHVGFHLWQDKAGLVSHVAAVREAAVRPFRY